ncbi:MAG: patatin-like phospholipase family protein [Caldisericaceae bacterium]
MKKVGLVLSGGGARGIAHIGVLKVLEKEGLFPDIIVGASMGSIIGGLYAANNSPSEMEDFLKTFSFSNVLDKASPLYGLSLKAVERNKMLRSVMMQIAMTSLFVKKGFDSGRKIRGVLKEMTKGASFKDLRVPFACVSVDLRTGRRIVFNEGKLYKAIYSSMAIPPYFEPYDYNGMLLTDGGVLSNAPVDVAYSMGADRVVVVDVNKSETFKEVDNFKNAYEILLRVYELQEDLIYKQELAKSDLIIGVDVDVEVLDFSFIDFIIAQGEKACNEHLRELKDVWQK